MTGGYKSKTRDSKGCLDLDYLTSTLYPHIPGAVSREALKPASASPSKGAKKGSQNTADLAATSEQLAQATPSDAPQSPLLTGLDPAPVPDSMDVDSPQEPDQPTDPLHPKEQALADNDLSSAAAAAAADANSLQSLEQLGNGEVTANGEADDEDAAVANAQGSQAHATQLSRRKRSAAAAEMGGVGNGAAPAASLDRANAADTAAANGHVKAMEGGATEPQPAESAAEKLSQAAANEAENGDGMANDADPDGKMCTEEDPTDGVPSEPDPNGVAVDV